MKKLFFSLAVVSVVALCACSNDKAENATNENDTTATEQVAEEQPAEEVPIDQLTELTCDQYTITVPENYKASSRMVNGSCNLRYKGGEPFTTIAVDLPYKTADEFVASAKEANFKQIDDVTVDGNTYKVFVFENPAENEQEAYAVITKGDKTIRVRAMNGSHKMDSAEARDKCVELLKLALNNIKLK